MSASLTTAPARLARSTAAKHVTHVAHAKRTLASPASAQYRAFATSPSAKADPQRQQISISQATPNKKWAELSATQKAGRTASTGANLLTIATGMALTGAVFTLLYLEVFAPDSAANWFNRIHKRIREEPRCTSLLGRSIKAYGEPTSNRWSRNRPIASSTKKDKYGVEHLIMHFNVEGDIDKGVVNAHLVKRPGERDYEYRYLFLDVSGKPRVYLENADPKTGREGGRKKGLFGVQWGW